ncbi:succinylglutamate desuccinylase/aspartoacylase family protein [Natrinema sp. HArc-T2]|uniref:succinylglutamate desuccinylase/aspartoacylase domain-containing protein n=1 Tax=Natrinema sp. HArc-T2 TaxID=3242701 RepID=UPI00359CE20E
MQQTSMQVRETATKPAEFSIVVCLHGDETGPKAGVERLWEKEGINDLPLKYIVANERAIDKDVRYIENDLNRAFPGGDESSYESQLAQKILNEVRGTKVIDLHTTHSGQEPFAVIGQVNSTVKTLASATGLDKVVDQSIYASGGLVQHVDGISVECGQVNDEDASDNAYEITKQILTNFDIFSGDTTTSNPTVYQVYDSIPRPTCGEIEIIAENFTRLEPGDGIYRHDGEQFSSNEVFWPVLLAKEGYDDILGYKAKQRGSLSDY